MGLHGITWDCLGSSGIALDIMGLNGFAMDLNGITRDYMGLHVIVTISLRVFSIAQDIPEKRLHYLNSMVKLLCKCSATPKHSAGLYRPVIEQLMDTILVASNAGELMPGHVHYES